MAHVNNIPQEILVEANSLREAAEQHHSAEKRLPAHDWADWYASYITARHYGATRKVANQMADKVICSKVAAA